MAPAAATTTAASRISLLRRESVTPLLRSIALST